jgi:hypothetical protein
MLSRVINLATLMKNPTTLFATDKAESRRFSLKPAVVLLLILSGAFLIVPAAVRGVGVLDFQLPLAQETFPAPPSDRTLVYFLDEKGTLVALPFEAGTTPLSTEKVASGDKRSYVELKNESAAIALKSNEPRFYLFVPDAPGTHPPFIVQLTAKRGARRVTAMAQKGYKGFAIDSAQIIKPHYRVLGHEGALYYMEIRPREMLLPGEYAIIGSDLQRIATFRIAGAAATQR